MSTADQLEKLHTKGPVNFFLGRDPRAAQSVRWLLDNTAPDSVILIRGHWQGSLEIANALLYPRLLYSESSAPASASHIHGQRIASGTPDDPEAGVLVLANDGGTLRISPR